MAQGIRSFTDQVWKTAVTAMRRRGRHHGWWIQFSAALLTVALQIGAPAAARGGSGQLLPHVRAADGVARGVLEQAARRSPTIARQIAALQETDTIVIVETGYHSSLNGLACVLAATPGARYLRVRLRIPNDMSGLIRTLGHELQHALEIAGLPEIRDGASLAIAYARMGIRLEREGQYETASARSTGTQVALELGRRK